MKKIIAALLGMAVMSAPFAHDFHGPRHPQGHRPHHEMRRHGSHHGHPHIPPPRHRVEYHKHYHGNNVAEAVIVGGAIVTAAVILAN